MKTSTSFYFLSSFFLTMFLLSCMQSNQEQAAVKKICISDTMINIIRIDTARPRPMEDELSLSGEINFDDKRVTRVFAFSSGQLIKVNVSLGDKVAKGQVLAIIKSADIAGNYSDLSAAGNDLAIAKKQMENQSSLFKNGIASEREWIEAKEGYEHALTTVNKIKAQISINGGGKTTANGLYMITAPQSGYIVEKKINEGAFIRGDVSDNLFTIGDINEVWVWANVYETDIAKVREGFTAQVTTLAYPDSIFYGKVDAVYNVLDPITKVMRIKIKLPNAHSVLKPEMFANVTILNPTGKNSLCIPKEAIISDGGQDYVVQYHSSCDLSVKPIVIQKTIGENAFIKSGLQNGDKVISRHQILYYKALTEE